MKDKAIKAAKVMDLINKYPQWGARMVAANANCSPSYVTLLRKKMVHREEPVQEPMQEIVTTTDAILDERAQNYGKFIEGATIMQGFKQYMHMADNWRSLAPDQREALDMIMHKIGRILNGNPDIRDHWIDVSGYATLVADRLEGRIR